MAASAKAAGPCVQDARDLTAFPVPAQGRQALGTQAAAREAAQPRLSP